MSKLSTEIRSYFQSRSAQRKGQGKVLNILQLKHYITKKMCHILCKLLIISDRFLPRTTPAFCGTALCDIQGAIHYGLAT